MIDGIEYMNGRLLRGGTDTFYISNRLGTNMVQRLPVVGDDIVKYERDEEYEFILFSDGELRVKPLVVMLKEKYLPKHFAGVLDLQYSPGGVLYILFTNNTVIGYQGSKVTDELPGRYLKMGDEYKSYHQLYRTDGEAH